MATNISVTDLTKVYDLGEIQVRALRGVTVDILEGEFVAVIGPSGSGKSTFMHILGCLDRPSSGRYILDDHDVSKLSKNELAAVRNKKIGFVFQGFSDRARHHPNQLSGGQQQRVAIARALINRPAILLADEPTGNLDTRTSIEVMDIFQKLNTDRGITVLLITHEHEIAEYGTRIITFRDGKIVGDKPNTVRRMASDELSALPPEDDSEAADDRPSSVDSPPPPGSPLETLDLDLDLDRDPT